MDSQQARSGFQLDTRASMHACTYCTTLHLPSLPSIDPLYSGRARTQGQWATSAESGLSSDQIQLSLTLARTHLAQIEAESPHCKKESCRARRLLLRQRLAVDLFTSGRYVHTTPCCRLMYVYAHQIRRTLMITCVSSNTQTWIYG